MPADLNEHHKSWLAQEGRELNSKAHLPRYEYRVFGLVDGKRIYLNHDYEWKGPISILDRAQLLRRYHLNPTFERRKIVTTYEGIIEMEWGPHGPMDNEAIELRRQGKVK